MTASPHANELAVIAARAAGEKKAADIIALDVSERLVLTDVFLVVSGSNERNVSAIVDAIEEKLAAAGAKAARREGVSQARWVLLDFTDIIVHVQHEQDREFYALERLWRDCPVLPLPADVTAELAVP